LNFFREKNIPAEKISYPDYNNPIGKFIDEYLHGKHNLSLNVLFLLYCIDFIKDNEKIDRLLNDGKIVILDRYFTSTIAYQCMQGFSLESALNFAEKFGIKKPDTVFLLKISPETSIKRKMDEKHGKIDIFEKDKEFLSKVRSQYDRLAEKNVFGKWIVIDGEKSKDDVFSEIKKHLNI